MICCQFCNKFRFHLIFELTKVGISFPSIDSRHHSTRGEGSPETFKEVTLMMMFAKIRCNLLLAPFYNLIKTLDCKNFSWERNSNGIQSRSRSHEKTSRFNRKNKILNSCKRCRQGTVYQYDQSLWRSFVFLIPVNLITKD